MVRTDTYAKTYGKIHLVISTDIHIAAITNSSALDRYSTVTRPLLDRYVRYTPSALKPWIFWRSAEVLSVKR